MPGMFISHPACLSLCVCRRRSAPRRFSSSFFFALSFRMLLASFPGTDLGIPNLSLCFIPALAIFSIKMKKKNKFEQEKKILGSCFIKCRHPRRVFRGVPVFALVFFMIVIILQISFDIFLCLIIIPGGFITAAPVVSFPLPFRLDDYLNF